MNKIALVLVSLRRVATELRTELEKTEALIAFWEKAQTEAKKRKTKSSRLRLVQ